MRSVDFVSLMAVAKSGKGGNEDGKSSGKMSGEKASGLCSIHKASLTDQCKDKIIKVRHDPCPIANGKASGIFTEGHISSVMRTCLYSPMSTANFQELHWRNFFA
jgi:hypothetical protein